MARWTADHIPDQNGRVAIVTGANSGIGYHTALELARHGATVVLGCRSETRGQEAQDRIREALGAAGDRTVVLPLDLADLESVDRFVDEFTATYDRLDMLVNNAGVMVPPLGRTAQGFELQMGINHLGHFALTGRLLERLFSTENSRIVNVSSTAHRAGRIDLDDPNWERRTYNPVAAYGQSKLANLLFTRVLSERYGDRVLTVAAHPGWTDSNLGREHGFILFFSGILAQSSAMGALPTLRAAVDPGVKPNEYYGPRGPFQLFGYPVSVGRSGPARSERTANALWALSETLTGVAYPAA